MVKIDWTEDSAEDFLNMPPGTYLGEIADAKERPAKSGSLMFEVRIKAVEWGGRHLCWDYLMLEGKGRPFGIRKLRGLGFKDGAEIDADDLVGKRCYLAMVMEENEWQGKKTKRLVVDINAGRTCGYAPGDLENPPKTVIPGEEPSLKNMADAFAGGDDDADWDPFV